MDNKQAVKELYKICGELAVLKVDEFVDPMNLAIKALEENDKLKAENERLKQELENSVKFLCKPGDIVYQLYRDKNRGKVPKTIEWYCSKNTVRSVGINSNGEFFVNCEWFTVGGENSLTFLTKEEAENKLAELRGDK